MPENSTIRMLFESPQVRHRKIRNVTQGGVGIGTWLEVDLDQAHASERTRFAVVNIRRQPKEAFKRVGDIGLNLLGGIPL
jgi:hypothetical protein